MSRNSFLALAPADRELLLRLARESVPVMRAKWEESESKARAAVLASGVKANDVDTEAFRKAAQPLLDEYHRKPEIEALYRRIRDLA
jgi:TRAP-type C4-dicarboxylate transport system substrate-binding protein